MFELIAILLIITVAIVIDKLTSKRQPTSQQSSRPDSTSTDEAWRQYIASFRGQITTREEQLLIEHMLAGSPAHGNKTSTKQRQSVSATPTATTSSPPKVIKAPTKQDNALILLYFGAFLFVAATGLFVGFGELTGTVRTALVAILAAAMYGGGIWIFSHTTRLKQAGIGFAAIGMAIVPLVGLAAYNFIFEQAQAPAVWFLTSVVCLGLYTHAMVVFRSTLIGYLQIFTLLSLFESSIAVINAPLYYYVWALSLTGLLSLVLSTMLGIWPELRTSTKQLNPYFLPIAVGISLIMIPTAGSMQFAVTLLISAGYYGLAGILQQGMKAQAPYFVAAHVSTILGLSVGAYALQGLPAAAYTLLFVSAVHAVGIMLTRVNLLSQNTATVALAAAAVTPFVGYEQNVTIVSGMVATAIIGGLIAYKQQRSDSYGLMLLSILALPFVLGLVVIHPAVTAPQLLSMIAPVMLGLTYILLWHARQRVSMNSLSWRTMTESVFILGTAGWLLVGLAGNPWTAFVTSLSVAAIFQILTRGKVGATWGQLSGILVLIPLLPALDVIDSVYAVVAVTTALIWNIGTALLLRSELNRWLSTIIWFLLPIALGNGALGEPWRTEQYAWAYVVIMLCLLLSRAIALGRLLFTAQVPLATYAQSASLSYVTGYVGAATLAVYISLFTDASQLHTSLILIVLASTVPFVAYFIERSALLCWSLPPLLQLILMSTLQPAQDEDLTRPYLLLSSGLAICVYILCATYAQATNTYASAVRQASLVMAYIAPASVVVLPAHMYMAVSLLWAGGLTLYEARNATQATKEWAASVMVAAILWLLWFFGITNVQAYSHILAAAFAIFAYWRYTIRDSGGTDGYLAAMFATATIPLILQALGGTAGDLYGLILIVEQIGFMLIGMMTGRKFLTWWGLYIAVGAVLYQLRGLGWAMLAIIALVVIGIAIYQLTKQDES